MFEFLKRLFDKKEHAGSADIDPLTAVALTTDKSSDKAVKDELSSSEPRSVASDDYDGGDFDID